MTGRRISIWFFIGVLLVSYGTLILVAGIWELYHPPRQPRVLGHLRPAIWWGALLLALGGLYAWRFRPRRAA